MEETIFDYIAKGLAPVLPENVQVLALYAKTERDTDLVKLGIEPASPVAVGVPFRVLNLTLAAGVRRRLPDATARLDRIFRAIQAWIGSGRRSPVELTGVTIDAIIPEIGTPYAKGVDESEEYLVETIQAKVYATISTNTNTTKGE